jgi:hypothetical protein
MNTQKQAPIIVVLSAMMIGLWGCDFQSSDVDQSVIAEQAVHSSAVLSDSSNKVETLGPVAQRAEDVRRLQSMDTAASSPKAYRSQRQDDPRM